MRTEEFERQYRVFCKRVSWTFPPFVILYRVILPHISAGIITTFVTQYCDIRNTSNVAYGISTIIPEAALFIYSFIST